jgi:hypothetical protein
LIGLALDRDEWKYLMNAVTNIWVPKMLGGSRVTAQLAASRVVLSSIELVYYRIWSKTNIGEITEALDFFFFFGTHSQYILEADIRSPVYAISEPRLFSEVRMKACGDTLTVSLHGAPRIVFEFLWIGTSLSQLTRVNVYYVQMLLEASCSVLTLPTKYHEDTTAFNELCKRFNSLYV